MSIQIGTKVNFLAFADDIPENYIQFYRKCIVLTSTRMYCPTECIRDKRGFYIQEIHI